MSQYLSPAIAVTLLVITYVLLVFWPLIKILHRIGRSGWWSLLVFAWPIGLWLMALTRWPAFDALHDDRRGVS